MATDNGEVNIGQANSAGAVMPVALKPTVGRMVYYKARGSADGVFPKVDRAAVITDVRDVDTTNQTSENMAVSYQVRVCVMNPEGLFFSAWLDQGQEGGQWDWMPFQKDQQLRAGYSSASIGHAGGAGSMGTAR